MPELPSSLPPIFAYIDAQTPVRTHEHVAVVHHGGPSAARAAEFLRAGLSLDHHCCFLAAAEQQAALHTRLQEWGVDVPRHLQRHSLRFPAPGARDWMERAKGFFDAAEAAHAPAVRWLEEGTGAKPADISVSSFFEQHARLNYLVKLYPSVALCQYDTQQMAIPDLFCAIAVHRHLLVEGALVRDNPFYIPAEKFEAMTRDERERDLRNVFREVGFDLAKLLAALAGYGELQRPALHGPEVR